MNTAPAHEQASCLLRYLLDYQARHNGRLPTLSLMGQKLGYLSANRGVPHAREVLEYLAHRKLVVLPTRLAVDETAAKNWLSAGVGR